MVILSLKLGVARVLGGDAPIAKVTPSGAPPGLVNSSPILASASNSGGLAIPGGKAGKGAGKVADWTYLGWGEPQPKKIKVHNVQDGKHVTNRAGYALCQDFNEGTCQSQGTSIYCPKNWSLVHLCNKCLQPHPANSPLCRETTATGPPRSIQKGGAGKGKGWTGWSTNN